MKLVVVGIIFKTVDRLLPVGRQNVTVVAIETLAHL